MTERGRDGNMQTDQQQQQSSDWRAMLVKSLGAERPMSCLSTVFLCKASERNLI